MKLFHLLIYITGFFLIQGITIEEHGIEDVEDLMETDPRNLFLFFGAEWCQFCENMKLNTIRNEKVTEILNAHFYYVPFNVENQEDLLFKGVRYKSSKVNYHQFVQAITGKQKCELPYLAIINQDNEILYESSGFIDSRAMLKILTSLK